MQHLDEGTIHAWIDGALDAETARDLETHLASCEDCARLAAEARGLVAASSRILTALDNVPGKVIPASGSPAKPAERVVTRRWPMPFWMRTAAAVVIVAGASALVMTGKLNSPEHRIDLTAPVAMEAAMTTDSALIAPTPTSADLASTLPSAAGKQTAATFSARGARTGPRAGRPGSITEGVARTADSSARAMNEAQKAVAEQASDRADDASRRAGSGAASQLRDSSGRGSDIAAMAPRPAPQIAASAPPAVTDKRAESLRQSGEPVRIQPGISGTLSRRAPSAPVAVAPAPRVSGDHPAVGCYSLSMSPWSGGAMPFGAPPARIELDSLTSVQESIRGLNLVHPGPGAASNKAPLAYWRVLGDSVYVTWRDDERGVVLKLPVGGEVLAGSARTFAMSSTGGPSQTSLVEARRINCRE